MGRIIPKSNASGRSTSRSIYLYLKRQVGEVGVVDVGVKNPHHFLLHGALDDDNCIHPSFRITVPIAKSQRVVCFINLLMILLGEDVVVVESNGVTKCFELIDDFLGRLVCSFSCMGAFPRFRFDMVLSEGVERVCKGETRGEKKYLGCDLSSI